MIVNMHDAKTNLSKLVDRANEGEEIVLARAGKPVARLVPIGADSPAKAPRRLGLFAGQPLEIADDFDELPPEIMQALTDPKIFP